MQHSSDLNPSLKKYAELIIKVGLNLQPGQRLLIGDPVRNLGVPLGTAPLVRHIAKSL
jgi:leucyl aminopeptidase (aminopeptidase T)